MLYYTGIKDAFEEAQCLLKIIAGLKRNSMLKKMLQGFFPEAFARIKVMHY
jgi:hypothetical protein